MQSIKTIVKNIAANPKPLNKYVSKEYQDYGLFLATKLNDTRYKSLYIKLAKDTNRALLQQAFSFAIDYPNAKNKGKIFLWKLTELKKKNKETTVKSATPLKKT